MKDSKGSSSNCKDTKKIRKILNEQIKLGINKNSDSEAEDDLRTELYPLSHYINNREEMIEQMFSIIKGSSLKKMLPPILKDIPLDELKADCLIHLLGMSTKRILAILEGREINSSSDSETHSDSSTSPSKQGKTNLKPIVIKQEGCSDISDNSEEVVLVDPDFELLNSKPTASNTKDSSKDMEARKRHHNSKKRRRNSQESNKKGSKKMAQNKSQPIEPVEQIEDSPESSSDNENNVTKVPTEGKTLLEILELEMRARAIRALLKKSGTTETQENVEKKSEYIDVSVTSKKSAQKNDSTDKKVTPTKNFRKKKRKSDDVIVVAPKVVTIDLTEENEPGHFKEKTVKTDDEKLGGFLDNVQRERDKDITVLDKFSQIRQNIDESSSSPHTAAAENSNKDHVISIESKNTSDTIQSNLENAKKTESSKHNWAQRWLESKEVKKVVSTSKICGNIRKRIKSAKLAKQNQENCLKISETSQEIQGSVVEYQNLSKSSKVNDGNVEIPDSNNSEINTVSNSVKEHGGKHLETDLKEESSIEQVQCVSSTKSEMITENIAKEKLQCTSITKKDNINSNQILSDDKTSNLQFIGSIDSSRICEQLISCPFDTSNLSDPLKNNEKFNDCELDSVKVEVVQSLSNEDDSSRLQCNTKEFQMKTGNLYEPNQDDFELNSCIEEEKEITCNFNLNIMNRSSKLEDIEISEDIINDTKLQICNDSDSKNKNVVVHKQDLYLAASSSNELSESTNDSKCVSDKECNLEPDLTKSNTVITKTIVKNCNVESQLLDNCISGEDTTHDINEPETLEINITDEDREID